MIPILAEYDARAWEIINELAGRSCVHRFRKKADKTGAYCKCLVCKSVTLQHDTRKRLSDILLGSKK